MSDAKKNAMLALIRRCETVINEEMNLLQNWEQGANLPARRVRCGKWRISISQTSSSRIQSLLQQANATSSGNVNSSPTADHDLMVLPNERDLAGRRQLDVNNLSDPFFTLALKRAVDNSADSYKDAEVILKDCTV